MMATAATRGSGQGQSRGSPRLVGTSRCGARWRRRRGGVERRPAAPSAPRSARGSGPRRAPHSHAVALVVRERRGALGAALSGGRSGPSSCGGIVILGRQSGAARPPVVNKLGPEVTTCSRARAAHDPDSASLAGPPAGRQVGWRPLPWTDDRNRAASRRCPSPRRPRPRTLPASPPSRPWPAPSARTAARSSPPTSATAWSAASAAAIHAAADGRRWLRQRRARRPPPAPRRSAPVGQRPLIAGIATLLLAMGVGVLIGRSGKRLLAQAPAAVGRDGRRRRRARRRRTSAAAAAAGAGGRRQRGQDRKKSAREGQHRVKVAGKA